jgi:mannobiose 2-epimerase
MLGLFHDHIILHQTDHLGLFFSNEWTLQSHIVSYGHDIEASWLLYEAAELLHDEMLLADWKKISIAIAKASLEGIDIDGGLCMN